MTGAAFNVRLVVRSPFLFAGLDPAAINFDASALRDGHGRPILPGDHVRGHFLHAARALAAGGGQASIDLLFGGESPAADNGAHDVPNRGCLVFGDLAATARLDSDGRDQALPPRSAGLTTRVAIDDATGAADSGSLQSIELAAEPGREVVFEGCVRVLNPDQQTLLVDLFDSARYLIPAMGAIKTAGFGELVADKCTLAVVDTTPVEVTVPETERLAFDVGFDAPLLVNARQISRNMFVGSTIVPGSAIKGALADEIKRSTGEDPAAAGSPLGKVLEDIVIGHAYPLVQEHPGDRAVPDCVVAARDADGQVQFADLTVEGDLDRLQTLANEAPAFAGDWKGDVSKAARAALERPESGLDEHLQARGRVGIDGSGIAEDGQLFVTAPIPTAGHVWRFVVDSAAVGDRDGLATILGVLAAGLGRVGKTDAMMQVARCQAVEVQPVDTSGNVVRLVLETPAVLTAADDATDLHTQYERYFRHVLADPDLSLLDWYARRTYAGRYQATRYRQGDPNKYLPFELTEPGAVFQIGMDMNDGAGRLTELVRTGLPAIRWLNGAAKELTWRECPFVPQNGFGAISVPGPGSMVAGSSNGGGG